MKQPNMLTHKCGQCAKVFQTEGEYLKHKCPVSGFTPKELDNLNMVYQSEPPQIANKGKISQLTEKEILKAVNKARKSKKT